MDYSYSLFLTKKTVYNDTPYRYVLEGAFYDVFTDGHGDYHMAKETKASLRERLWFYENCIRKAPYPVFDKERGVIFDNQKTFPTLFETLGLPEEVYHDRDPLTGKERMLTGEEVLNRISFEDHLFFGYGDYDHLTPDILLSNDYIVNGLVNYWVSKGFYFPNPERAIGQNSYNGFDYPVYLDERLLPERIRRNQETPEKLFIDFCPDPLAVNRKTFLEDFRPLRSLKLSEQFALAFNDQSPEKAIAKASLRNYFSALLCSLANEFFSMVYHQNNVFPYTVLDEDLGMANLDYPLMAVGSKFMMPMVSLPTLAKKGEETVTELPEKHYALFSQDIKGLELAFAAMKAFFKTHPSYAYMPFLAIKLLGLPYPAFLISRFFDFAEGSFKQFLSLFGFVTFASYRECLLFLEADHDGIIHRRMLSSDPNSSSQDEIAAFLAMSLDHGIYVSNPDALNFSGNTSTLIRFRNPSGIFRKLINGDRKTVERILLRMNQGKPNPRFASLLPFLSAEEGEESKNGRIEPIAQFFSNLNAGYTSLEAFSMTFNTNEMARVMIRIFFSFLLNEALFESAENLLHKEHPDRKTFATFFLKAGRKEFYDPTLPYPHVTLGRYFLFYRKENGGKVYLDSSDRERVRRMLSVYRKYFLPQGEFPYLYAALGKKEIVNFPIVLSPEKEYTYLDEYVFLGYPLSEDHDIDYTKDPLAEIRFEDGLSLFNREDHKALIKNTPSLLQMQVFHAALDRGFFLLGSQMFLSALYPLMEKLSKEDRMIFDPDFVKIYIYSHIFPFQDSALYEKLLSILGYDEKTFSSRLLSYATGESGHPQGNLAHEVGAIYAGEIADILAEEEKSRLFALPTKYHLFSVPYGPYDLSAGRNFYAFRKTGTAEPFLLPEEDRPLLIQAIRYLKTFYQRPGKRSEALIAACLGLPPVYYTRIMKVIAADDLAESFNREILFGKKPEDLSEKDLPNYFDEPTEKFILYEDRFDPNTTKVYHEALKEGLFIADGKSPIRYLRDDETIYKHPEDSEERLRKTPVHAFPLLSGEVKLALLPDAVSYSYSVDRFLRYVRKYTSDSFFALTLKETLLSLFSKDPKYLPMAVNLLHSGKKTEFKKLVLNSEVKITLKNYPKQFTSSYLVSMVALYLFYLEERILLMIAQRFARH